MTDDSVAKAQYAATFARQRLFATAHEIQARLEPSRVIDEAVTDVRVRSREIAGIAGQTVREHPKEIAAAALVGALVGAHRPLFRLAGGLFGRRKATDVDVAS